MDPLTMAAIASVAVPAITGAIGGAKAGKANKDAERRRDEMAELYRNLKVPDLASQQYDAMMQEYAGDIDPALLASVPGLESAFNNISTDPRFTQAQYESLGGLDSLIAGGGMTDMDKLNFQRAQNAAAQASAQQQAGITRDMAERGIAGGGAELAQRLASAQGAANRSSDAAQDMAATAQQRALQALISRGSMAGDMQAQDFGQKSAMATARDAIARWNQQQAMETGRANQNAMNTAMSQNQQVRQGVNAANQGATNQSRQYNAGAVGTQYNQQLNKLGGISGQVTAQNADRNAAAERTANQYQGFGQAASAVLPIATKAYQKYSYDNMSGEEQDAYNRSQR
jgi:hypothetical protein